MRRNGNLDFYGNDEWEEVLALFIFIGAVVVFGIYMFMAWKVEYVSVFTRILGMFFAFIVSIYTIAFAVFGIILIIQEVKEQRKQGKSKKRMLYLVSGCVLFFVGPLFFNFLYWGIIGKDLAVVLRGIPALIVAIPAARYYLRFVMNED